MISRFFKKKPKPAPNSKAKPEPVRKPAPKKTVAKKKAPPAKPVAAKPVVVEKPVVTKTPVPKPVAELPEETYHFSVPSFKPGKIITAEGWKRMMMRKAGKK